MIIPVYNHRQQVAEVIRQARVLELPILVVDDGSTDGTGAVLEQIPGITLLRHAVNQGKGAAILTGFAAASPACDWAMTIDADGQHLPEDGLALLEMARECGRVIVVGNRQGMLQDNVPWTSRCGRAFSNFWVWVAGGPAIGDSQSGFRLYPLPEAMQLGVKARRYQFEVEILANANQQEIRTVEVPVRVVYQPPGVRVSHFRPFLDFCRNSVTFSRLITARILGAVFRK